MILRSDGGAAGPSAELEDLKRWAARARPGADLRRENARAADPPGSALPRIDRPHMGRTCGDVVWERQGEARARIRARGHDPVLPPRAKPPALPGDASPGPPLVDVPPMGRGGWFRTGASWSGSGTAAGVDGGNGPLAHRDAGALAALVDHGGMRHRGAQRACAAAGREGGREGTG